MVSDSTAQIAADFAAKWTRPVNERLVEPPGSDAYESFLRCVSDSAPGLDGIPVAAWRAAGRFGIDTLLGAGLFLRRGLRMPMAWNAAILAFSPKGEEAADAHGVFRTPRNAVLWGSNRRPTRRCARFGITASEGWRRLNRASCSGDSHQDGCATCRSPQAFGSSWTACSTLRTRGL